MKRGLLFLFLPLLLGAAEWKFTPCVLETDGVWKFSSVAAHAELKNSAVFGSTGKGFTISAAVKLPQAKAIKGSGWDAEKQIVYQHDIIASKGGEFVFGRRSDAWVDQLYFNFNDGKKWAVPLDKGVTTPRRGKWAVWTVVAQPQVKLEEGRSTTLVTLFVNGEPELRKEYDGIPEHTDLPVVFGSGTGIKGDLWGFAGELAEPVAIDRALSEDEVLALAGKSKKVKITAGSVIPLLPELDQLLTALDKKAADAETHWRFAALRRAAAAGSDQKQLLALVKGLGSGKAWETLPNAPKLVRKGNLTLMLQEGSGKSGSPLLGAFDHIAKRELFGKSCSLWSAECAGEAASAFNPNGDWECVSAGDAQWRITRTAAPQVKALLTLTLKPNRLEAALAITNSNPAIRLKTVNFPQVRFAEKKAGQSFLVHPEQQGLLIPNPTRSAAPRPAWYPSGWLNMQLGAYYDDLSGVYCSPEDPEAGIKCCTVRGRSGDLECMWSIPVACCKQKHGGNSFPVNKAVIEVFSGNWFDAALCYRRFAWNNTKWSAPRTRETPKWFRENTLWFVHWTLTDKNFNDMPELMRKLRDYFEMPFGIHWYRYYDSPMPHFLAKPRVEETQKKLHEAGVYTKAYIDTRLWSELDGPGRKSDRMFSSHGKPSAIVNEDGSWNYERYSKLCREVVMCPTSKLWQDYMLQVVERMHKNGFDMIYHDQVGASRPFPCFAVNHDHKLNDPDCWTQGYYALFRRIDELNRRYPELCHDTEDANEAWLNLMDGFLAWRWTQDRQIPLFAAVYGGRVQFTGRHYSQTSRGEEAAFFAKAAGQLVQGEQIGWFTTAMLLENPQRIVYAKQMAHLRKLQLRFFNGGTMERPLEFERAPELQKVLWGVAAPKPAPVTLPVIRHGVWKSAAGDTVILWVNTADTEQSALPRTVPGKWLICRTDGSVTETGKTAPGVRLKPYGFEVWYSGNRAEAEKIASSLKKIGAFTAGNLLASFGIIAPDPEHPAKLDFEETPVPDAFQGKGALVLKGDEKKEVFLKIPMILKPNRYYRIHFALKQEQGVKGRVAVANYSKEKKLKLYMNSSITQYGISNKSKVKGLTDLHVTGNGTWSEMSVTFKTDQDQFNTGLYLYNTKSKGAIMLDALTVTELKSLLKE